MNLGYASFYCFHEMCCPYVIAGIYGFDKNKVEEKFATLIGLDTAKDQAQRDWMEYSIIRVDCTKLYHMAQLDQEIDYDIIRAFQRWAPELLEKIKKGEPGDEFIWSYRDGTASRFEWLNRFHNVAWEAVKAEINSLPKVRSGRS